MVYVDGKGAVTWLDKSSYDNGKVMAEVPHFSTYGVAYKAPAPVFTDTTSHWAKADIEFVATTAYYAPYVAWAAEQGIVNGTTDTTFAPDTNISREQMAVIMQKYALACGYTVPKTREAVTFADNGSIESWAKEAVKAMQMAGVMNGKALTGWKEIGGKWYYFDENGAMAVNTKIDGYEVGPDGARK